MTGEACGFTAMRSLPFMTLKYRAVRIVTAEAQDAGWPPIFVFSGFGRPWLA
jgi:hypothetical protein